MVRRRRKRRRGRMKREEKRREEGGERGWRTDLPHDHAAILSPSGLSSVAALLKAGCGCLV